MSGSDLDLKSAQSAFDTFFSKGKEAPASPQSKERTVMKVDAQSASTEKSVQTLSVDEAESIIESRKSFEDILKELDVKYSDLFVIIDSFLEKGFYEQRYSIKSFEFVYRSKKVHSIDTINDVLDGAKYTLTQAAGQLLLERSMAASLVYFKLGKSPARVFEHNSVEDDELTLKFIKEELASPIYSLMATRLQRFEFLMGLATRDEAIERFLAHTQD